MESEMLSEMLKKRIRQLIEENERDKLAKLTERCAHDALSQNEKTAFVVGRISVYKEILAWMGYEI